jgi:hypothetical protein
MRKLQVFEQKIIKITSKAILDFVNFVNDVDSAFLYLNLVTTQPYRPSCYNACNAMQKIAKSSHIFTSKDIVMKVKLIKTFSFSFSSHRIN